MLSELPPARPGASRRSGLLELRASAERRDLTRTDGAGGYFVPPLHLIDEYAAGRAPAARSSRPAARSRCPAAPTPSTCRRSPPAPRPPSRRPTTPRSPKTDLTDALITVPVRTIAGQQDMAMQLLDQSPSPSTRSSSPTSSPTTSSAARTRPSTAPAPRPGQGHPRRRSGGNAITYTDASPTVPELYPKIADALARRARRASGRSRTAGSRRAATTGSRRAGLLQPAARRAAVSAPMNPLGIPGDASSAAAAARTARSTSRASHWMTDAMPPTSAPAPTRTASSRRATRTTSGSRATSAPAPLRGALGHPRRCACRSTTTSRFTPSASRRARRSSPAPAWSRRPSRPGPHRANPHRGPRPKGARPAALHTRAGPRHRGGPVHGPHDRDHRDRRAPEFPTEAAPRRPHRRARAREGRLRGQGRRARRGDAEKASRLLRRAPARSTPSSSAWAPRPRPAALAPRPASRATRARPRR
jgi:hypothetical protein